MRPRLQRGLLLVVVLLASSHIHAVAYCALRDPVKTIYQLFPEADNYRSIVRTVGRNERAQILDALGLNLHFNELGRHSLYVAQKQGQVLGFVHARTELSEWGLAEYAWAIGTDQTIQGVKVQRARDPNLLKPDALARVQSKLLGRSLAELRPLLGPSLDSDDALAASLLSSAAKTLAITASVWPDEVEAARAHQAAFSIAEEYVLEPVAALFDADLLHTLVQAGLPESPSFARNHIKGFRLVAVDGTYLGLVAQTEIDSVEPSLRLWWTLNAEGAVEAVVNEGDEPLPPALSALSGYTPKHVRDCSGLAELAALELSLLAQHHARVR